MAAKQARQLKQSKKGRKKSTLAGPSLSRHYSSPGRAQLDMERHLLFRPVKSNELIEDLPWSIDDIEIKIRIPKDLTGNLHSDDRITIPMDAKHRASNWREILQHLERLGGTEEDISRLSEETEQMIIRRLIDTDRILVASSKVKFPVQHLKRPAAKSQVQNSLVISEQGNSKSIPANSPQETPQEETHCEPRSSAAGLDLGSLSTKELYELAQDISGQLQKKTETVARHSRSKVVQAFAKACARGICQFCRNPAQYNDLDGTPRLHVHHICYLAENGEDSIHNVVAICPNCHDIIHERQQKRDADHLRDIVNKHLSSLG